LLDQSQEPTIGEIHIQGRERLVNRHAQLMDKILSENSHKDKYWILGMAMCKRKNGRTTIRPWMKAFDVQPEVRKEAYLYEIDNIAGSRTLLWVMHPNNKLSMPSIGKTIRVADDSGDNILAAEVTGV
jgi:hypothetical protein